MWPYLDIQEYFFRDIQYPMDCSGLLPSKCSQSHHASHGLVFPWIVLHCMLLSGVTAPGCRDILLSTMGLQSTSLPSHDHKTEEKNVRRKPFFLSVYLLLSPTLAPFCYLSRLVVWQQALGEIVGEGGGPTSWKYFNSSFCLLP
jgi:hypothetical protein